MTRPHQAFFSDSMHSLQSHRSHRRSRPAPGRRPRRSFCCPRGRGGSRHAAGGAGTRDCDAGPGCVCRSTDGRGWSHGQKASRRVWCGRMRWSSFSLWNSSIWPKVSLHRTRCDTGTKRMHAAEQPLFFVSTAVDSSTPRQSSQQAGCFGGTVSSSNADDVVCFFMACTFWGCLLLAPLKQHPLFLA